MNIGYIKLFRSVREHWIYEDPAHFKAWFDILSEVNFTEKRTKIGTKFEICGRGQSLYSLESWARIFGKGWNKTSVRRFFKLLETDEMIVFENLDFRTTRITVVNYEEYQSPIPMVAKPKPEPAKETPSETKELKPKAAKKEKVSNEGFEAFYKFYDKRVDEAGTQKEYEKLTKEELSMIDAHLPKYIQAKPDKQFRKDPKKYLKEKAFYDEVIMPTNVKTNQEQKNKLTTDNGNYRKGTINLSSN